MTDKHRQSMPGDKRGHNSKSLLFPSSVRRALIILPGIALIPIMMIQAWTYYDWYRQRVAEETEVTLQIARSVAMSFESFLHDVSRKDFALGTALARLSPYSNAAANQFLQANAAEYTAVRFFRWANAEGEILAASDDRSIGLKINDRGYYREIVGGEDEVFGNLFVDRVTSEPVIVIARAVRDGRGTLQGIALALIDAEKLGSLALPVRQPQDIAIMLFDRRGEIVYHRPALPLPKLDWMKTDPLLGQALEGHEVTGAIDSPTGGEQRIAARAPLSSIGWVAGADRPKSGMLAPLTRSLLLNSGLLLGVTGISLFLAVSIARMVYAALSNLRQHALAVGEGRLEHRARVKGFRELSELAESFNRMAAQLQERREAEAKAIADLTRANHELDAFAYSVSHDLRGPLRSIDGFSLALIEDYDERLDNTARDYLRRVRAASQRMGQLIDDLLKLSRVTRTEMIREFVNLSQLAEEIAASLQNSQPDRQGEFIIQKGLVVEGDGALLRVALENLLENAWKFTRDQRQPCIEFGMSEAKNRRTYFVRDNGAGFDMSYAGKLFGAFQRLHTTNEFPGTGIGLATVQRIIHRHGGSIWAQGEVAKGAAFFFTL